MESTIMYLSYELEGAELESLKAVGTNDFFEPFSRASLWPHLATEMMACRDVQDTLQSRQGPLLHCSLRRGQAEGLKVWWVGEGCEGSPGGELKRLKKLQSSQAVFRPMERTMAAGGWGYGPTSRRVGGGCMVQGSVLPGGAVHILVQNRKCEVQGYMIKVTGYDDKMKVIFWNVFGTKPNMSDINSFRLDLCILTVLDDWANF